MSEEISRQLIKNYEGTDIASNELLVNIVLNRVFKKLFSNDQVLLDKANSINKGLYRVLPWDENKTYVKNDLVWYVDVYATPAHEKEYEDGIAEIERKYSDSNIIKQKVKFLQDNVCTVTLYLLRAITNNPGRPVRTIVDMIPLFDTSGWKNENPMGSIYTDYFEEFTADTIAKKLYSAHEAATQYHKFGLMQKFEDIGTKVLKNKMSNIDPSRSRIYFPNETILIQESKTIITGACRKWDCGLLEYDITYKLGDSDVEYSNYNIDGTVKLQSDIDVNYLRLANNIIWSSSNDIYDNRRYYLNESDNDIFVVPDGKTVSEAGITQHNTNSKINSYCGTIRFPIPFIDRDYSIFPVATSNAITSEGNIVKNINNMVFVNKAKNSVTALLVIPNYGGTDYKVLGENIFRCRMTGRWK